MKKLRFINSALVAAAIATPMSFLSSCAKKDYSALADAIKTSQMAYFEGLSSTHRGTWDCQQAYEYIREIMEDELNYQLAGRDIWSTIPEVQAQAAVELADFAARGHVVGLPTSNQYGNLWYDIPATEGHEEEETVMLQSHYDMVLDFATAADENAWWGKHGETGEGGISISYDEENETMNTVGFGSSLGADDGMGVALMLAIAEHQKEFTHGPIRLMFTADESGATNNLAAGAKLLCFDQVGDAIYGQTLEGLKPFSYEPKASTVSTPEISNIVSIDGFVKGDILRSAAGIHECQIRTATPLTGTQNVTVLGNPTDENAPLGYKVSVTGLKGGNSAMDITKGYANALKILMHMIFDASDDFHIVSVNCNSGAYKICSGAEAIVTCDHTLTDKWIQEKAATYRALYLSHYPKETGLTITAEPYQYVAGTKALSRDRSRELCQFSEELEYGPISWIIDPKTKEPTDNVQTSANFGPLTVGESGSGMNIEYHVVTRSSNAQELQVYEDGVHTMAVATFDWINKATDITDIDDPVWEIKKSNDLISQLLDGYKNSVIKAQDTDIHAWAEIACFPEMFVKLGMNVPNMACIGPTIFESHTIKESLYTDTLDSVSKALLYLFDNQEKL